MARTEQLYEIRPGRRLWVTKAGDPRIGIAGQKTLIILVHGGCAHSQQVQSAALQGLGGPRSVHTKLKQSFVTQSFLLSSSRSLLPVQWRQQEQALLETGASFLSFDALGCGRSEKPVAWAAYHPQELYQDLVELYESQKKEYDRVVLVGHSFGAALSLQLAAHEKDTIAGLILMGAYFPPKEEKHLPLFSLMRWLFYLPNIVLKWIQPSLTESFLAAAFSKATWKARSDLVEQERQHSNANPPHMFKAFHRQVGGAWAHKDYVEWAASIKKPVAIIYGDEDRITPLFQNSTLLRRHLADAEVTVIPDASHQVMQEKPDQVNACITAFLERAVR